MLPTCRFTERGPGPEKCPSKTATDSLWILHCGLHSCFSKLLVRLNVKQVNARLDSAIPFSKIQEPLLSKCPKNCRYCFPFQVADEGRRGSKKIAVWKEGLRGLKKDSLFPLIHNRAIAPARWTMSVSRLLGRLWGSLNSSITTLSRYLGWAH